MDAKTTGCPVDGGVRALLGRGDREEALRRYGQARRLEGFEPDEALEALNAEAQAANEAPAADRCGKVCLAARV